MHIYLTKDGLDHIRNNLFPIVDVENRFLSSMPKSDFDKLIHCYSKYITRFKEDITDFIVKECKSMAIITYKNSLYT